MRSHHGAYEALSGEGAERGGAEREGFEPSSDRKTRTGFRDLLGWLFVAVMAILFGAAGALIALAVSLAAVYRPAPRKSGR